MPPPLLRAVNVAYDANGRLFLEHPDYHGCAVFAPSSRSCFEVQVTAQMDDLWEDKAGSYCLGIINRADVPKISPASGGELHDTFFMQEHVGVSYSMSTGSFRFSSSLFDEYADQVFSGSLENGCSLIMKFHDGSLKYRLGGHAGFTDVTSRTGLAPRIESTFEGKGSSDVKGKCKGKDNLWKGKGKLPLNLMKGKGKSFSDGSHDEYGRFGPFAPVIWLFSHSDRAPAPVDRGIEVGLRSVQHRRTDGLVRTMSSLWDERHFTDCTILCKAERFEVHRAILCTSSPVFNAAFTGRMREANDAVFEIRECECPQAVSALLEFMYKGVLPSVNTATLIALLPLAAQYEVEELCTITAELLVDTVSVQNARDVVKILRPFHERPCVTDAWSSLLQRLKSDDAMLSEALV